MLTYLELENFRAFSKRVRLDVRPITVLIGKNSSGKSTVLKFLQMLRQSVNGHEGAFFKTDGGHVSLGAWRDLKNDSTSGRYLKFALGFRSKISPLSYYMRSVMESTGPAEAVKTDFGLSDLPWINYRLAGERFYLGDGTRGKFEIIAEEAGTSVFQRKSGTLNGITFLGFPVTESDPDLAVRSVLADQAFLSPAREFFKNLCHLGPARSDSPRTIQAESPPDGEVGHRGEYALGHLVRILDSAKRKAELDFIVSFCKSVLRMDRLELREQIAGLYSSFEARNMETEANHWLADFGFGVSQCLPIFVQGALLNQGHVLTIEQPEAQLHPSAQLELGSFFADLWKKRGVPSLIETHSGNILLRLRRLVRAGHLQPGDVSVAYFHVEEGTTRITNMPVKPDGELDGNLPMEFFGADVFEAMEFNALPRPAATGSGHAG